MTGYHEKRGQNSNEITRGWIEVREPKRNPNSKKALQDIGHKHRVAIFFSQNPERICRANVAAAELSHINTSNQAGNESERDGA
jgi:hypothetical protein